MCNRNSQDPLVDRLFRQDKLCLVGVAREPDELSPGKVIVTWPDDRERPAVIVDLADLFDNIPDFKITDADYRPIIISESSRQLSADTVVALSRMVSATTEPEKVKIALQAADARTLSVKLAGAKRCDLDVGKFEPAFRGAKPTRQWTDYYETGCICYLVTRTVTATHVQLKATSAFKAGGQAELAQIGSAAVKFALRDSSTIAMDRTQGAMVIGFQGLRINWLDDRTALTGIKTPPKILGSEGAELDWIDPEQIAPGDSIFLYPVEG